MRSITPKKQEGLTVGAIVDTMASLDEFKHLGRGTVFAVAEIFLVEYVGLPGQIVTKKFTPEAAQEIAERVGISVQDVVKIVAVFRMRAGQTSNVKTKLMKSFQKIRIRGGGIRSSPVSKL